MLLRRTTTLALTSLLAFGATVLSAPTAHAETIGTLAELQSALADCGTVALDQDVSAPEGILTLPGCDATLDLDGHELDIRRAAHEYNHSGTFTIDDSSESQTGRLTADSRGRGPNPEFPGQNGDPYPAIATEYGHIIVNGGTVTAIGGALTYPFLETEQYDFSAPGIGNTWTAEGSITVNDGTVIAVGGPAAPGIGGTSGYWVGDVGTDLTVNGGTVQATGGPAMPGTALGDTGGPGVGSGQGRQWYRGSSSGTTTVNGGTLTATGGSSDLSSIAEYRYAFGGTGIGGGMYKPAGTLIVNGGEVIAQGGDSHALDSDGYQPAGGMGIGAGQLGNYSADQIGTQGEILVGEGATLVAASGDGVTPEGRTAHTGRSIGIGGSGETMGDITVSGTLRLLGEARLIDYTYNGSVTLRDRTHVTSTGKIVGAEDDPTTGASISGSALIRNDGVIALAANQVSLGVTGAHNHLVTFVARGGSTADPVRVFARSFEDGYRTLPTPTRAGYTFEGWNTAADGSGDTIGSTSELPTGDLTVYAQWKGVEITVAKPTITGSAVVGQTLTVTPGAVTPTGTTSTFTWYAGEDVLGTGPTYTVGGAYVDYAITVVQTASKAEHDDATNMSDPTDHVTKATFTSTGGVEISGTPKVGSTLTATSTVETTPASTGTSGQWFRGDTGIDDAFDTEYILTADDVSSTIRYVETQQRLGYHDVVTSSDPTAKITGGTISVAKPTITGDAVVDQTLTVTAGAVTPSDATSTYTWLADEEVLGTGTTYSVKPADVDHAITVVHTASLDDHDDASAESDATEVVSKATFSSTGDITIGGTPKVGNTLTATSTVAATPASTTTSGQWFRGSSAIDDATDTEYTLTLDDLSSTIRYVETQQRAGYNNLVTTSDATAKVTGGVITVAKPTISGDAIVDQTLTVTPGAVTPSGTTSTYTWLSGEDVLGTGTTYPVKPADVGKTITVSHSAAKDDHDDATTESDPTDAVARATFASTGDLEITGTPKVGQELTATSTVTTTPASTSTAGQWFRGADPIVDATDTTYTLTNADASSIISFVETKQRDGYIDLISTAEASAAVTGGVITVAKPTITGNAVVDQTLTVTPGTVTPTDTSVSFAWRSGLTTLGTGPTYQVKPSDVGHTITVTQTAAKDDHDSQSADSDATASVAEAVFSTGPTASFSGVLRIGEELTAVEGAPLPTPDAYSYQWFADERPIDGATGKTYTLTSAQKGKTITVRVIASRDGYVDASHTSAASAAVAPDQAPTLTLATAAASVRLGQSTTLQWDSTDAASVTASGAWSGPVSPAGVQSVTPASTGTSTYVLTAENTNGSTTAQVAIDVSQPAATLQVRAPAKAVSGKTITVTTSGLAPGEAYSIAIGGIAVTTGQADGAGNASLSVRVPTAVTGGRHTIRVTGSLADRVGQTMSQVSKKNVLKVRLARAAVRAKGKQKVTITRLEPGEKIVVKYRGKRISSARAKANSKGVYTTSFRVGAKKGRVTIRVTAEHNVSHRSKSFRVIR